MFLSILFLMLLLIIFFKIKSSISGSIQLPPGPNMLQLILEIPELGKNPHIAFKTLAKTYGPVMSLRLGGQLVIVVSSSSVAKQVLRTHDHIFSGRYLPSIYYKIPEAPQSSLAMSKQCDETWRFLRGLSHNAVFSSKSIETTAYIRKAKVQELVDYLCKKQGEEVDIEDVMGVTIYNILSNILASKDIFDIRGGTTDKRVRALVAEIVQMVSELGLADLFPVIRKIDFWSNAKGIEILKKIMSVWEETINQRKATTCDGEVSKRRGDLLDLALESGNFSIAQICLLLLEILIAGADTSTITTVWLMVELMRHPDMLNRVRDEVSLAFEGDMLVNESILTESKYLQACIKETLRFHIPGPFLLPHRATETCEIGGYVVPRDSMVLINAWAIGRDPNDWGDGSVFRPERFLDSKTDCRGSHFEFIPFSAGKRMCPGLNVALKNMQLIVATMVHCFDWALKDGGDVTMIDVDEKFGTVLKKEKPMYLVPTKRENK